MHPIGIYHLRYHQAQNEKSPRYTGINRLHWDRKLLKALPRIATTPNATTLYGTAMLDLTREPAVVTVENIRDHYWSIQLHDNYSRWWHMIGSQFNAPGPVRRLLVGPGWKGGIPPEFVGADIVESPSNFAGALGRVALTDDTPGELAIVNGIQDRITVMSLGAWIAAGKTTVKAEHVPVTRGDYPTYPGMEAVKQPGQLGAAVFLRWASLVLNDDSFTKQADSHKELAAFERFARLGLKAGTIFDSASLSPAVMEAVEQGMKDGRQAVTERIAEGSGVKVNGWDFVNDLGYRDTDWIERARNGYISLLGPVPSRSHVASFGLVDTNGRPLDSAHRYTITFDLDDMPPVTEFWEMPIYDREGQLGADRHRRRGQRRRSHDRRRGAIPVRHGAAVAALSDIGRGSRRTAMATRVARHCCWRRPLTPRIAFGWRTDRARARAHAHRDRPPRRSGRKPLTDRDPQRGRPAAARPGRIRGGPAAGPHRRLVA
jgi:hypothetical protein